MASHAINSNYTVYIYSIVKKMSRGSIALDDRDQYADLFTGLTKLLLVERVKYEIIG